jgi:pantoate--beta-alanine ligase
MDCDIVFLPTDQEMYPVNNTPIDSKYSDCMNILEGEKRPGHFLGVITIVHKFFNLIHPDRAYFGEKDYQQLWLIKLFAKNFHIPIEIKACRTIRNADGLALSSRNKNLTQKQQESARSLFLSLDSFRQVVKKKVSLDHKSFMSLKSKVISQHFSNSLIKLDYFEVIEDESFRFVNEIKNNQKYRILIAAYVGDVRLIDNMLIE